MLNFLLDYFFRVTTIDPAPTVSTAYLKQALIVVKPKVGVTPGEVHECTSMAEVLALTDNTDAQQNFDAGMSKVFVLPIATLNLTAALEGYDSEFFTILISSDFSDADIGGVFATAEINGIRYTAKVKSNDPELITIIYADTLTGNLATVSVNDLGNGKAIITVNIEAGVTTNETIYNALIASNAAMQVIDVDLLVPAGEPLADAGQWLPDGKAEMVLGSFKGVTGISSNDKEFLKVQARISNRCAFYRTSPTGAKNLFYAFGKLLANTTNWLNQQYIEMPYADDVETVGQALDFFEDRISFVIDDAQLQKRLSFFVCGGDAIVAPYIKRNLEIDLQIKALQFVINNQPQYTKANATLCEDDLQKVIDDYRDSKRWIEKGEVQVLLEQSNFVGTGKINIKKPDALWRFEAEFRQSLT